jgi:hypothetical protein
VRSYLTSPLREGTDGVFELTFNLPPIFLIKPSSFFHVYFDKNWWLSLRGESQKWHFQRGNQM